MPSHKNTRPRRYGLDFVVHDFVVMPDHLHVQFSVDNTLSVERAAQLIKGGFSYRANKELKFTAEIWQPGFSEVRIKDRQSFLRHREYIEQNPVKARLVDSPEKFPYSSAYFKAQKNQQGLKPKHKLPSGATEVAP